jgi:type II secretory pathway predicted ATPase ExeA
VKNQQAGTVLGGVSPARIFARPTAEDLWLGPTQTSALSQLSRSVPVQALLGPPSSGRTSLLRHLAGRSGAAVTMLQLNGPERLRNGVVKRLLRSAGVPANGLKRKSLRDRLLAHLRDLLMQGQRVVIQIDDADGFGAAAFDELLRIRTDVSEVIGGVQLQLVLEHLDPGSSPAADFLRHESAPGIAVLTRMNATEVSWYVHWRLERFGLPELFSFSALQEITRSAQGSFTAIDFLCQMTLLLLRNRSESQADESLVREAVRVLGRPRGEPVPVVAKPAAPKEPAGIHTAEMIISRDGQVVHRAVCHDRVMIGRSQFNDIQLEDQYLSRHHLAIVRGADGFVASDLNSVNGVLLNGRRFHSAPISDGDVISMGPYSVKISLQGRTLLPGEDQEAANLSVTWEMPAPKIPEPARLKLIK